MPGAFEVNCFAMHRSVKVIDLSKSIAFNRGDPFFMQVKVKHKRHGAAKLLVRLLGLPYRLFPKDSAAPARVVAFFR
jgi:hypothetical protein